MRISVLDSLAEHHEALHTQSRQWLVEEIDDFIKERDKDCEVLSVTNNFDVAGQSLAKMEVTQFAGFATTLHSMS